MNVKLKYSDTHVNPTTLTKINLVQNEQRKQINMITKSTNSLRTFVKFVILTFEGDFAMLLVLARKHEGGDFEINKR